MKNLEWKTCFKAGVSVIIVYLCIHYWSNISHYMGLAFAAVMPLILGLVMAYVLNILMSFYERHFFPKAKGRALNKSRRPICLLGSIFTLFGIATLVICLVTPQLIECIKMVINGIPNAIKTITTFLEKFDIVPEKIIASLSSVDWKSKIGEFSETIFSGVGNVVSFAYTALSSVFSAASATIIGFIFALYLLLDKDRLISQFHRIINKFLPEKIINKGNHVLKLTNDCFHRFIVGQCTEAIILGTLCMIGMLILRLPYASMVGALVAFTALIPIVGAFIGAGIGAFLIFTESPTKALIFLIFIVILQQIEGNLIYPKVVGSSMGLPGIWVLVAVTVGGGVLGIPGMLIGVPLMAVIYKLVKEKVNNKPQEELQEEPEKTT